MKPRKPSIAKGSLRLSGLFEAELLTELMLRYWKHPLADNEEFRQALLEAAAEVLKASIAGERLIQSVRPQDMNLVAAVWYAEFASISADTDESEAPLVERQRWLDVVRRSIPSCFCDPSSLT